MVKCSNLVTVVNLVVQWIPLYIRISFFFNKKNAFETLNFYIDDSEMRLVRFYMGCCMFKVKILPKIAQQKLQVEKMKYKITFVLRCWL